MRALVLLGLLLAACASSGPEIKSVAYDKTRQARLRVVDAPGASIALHVDRTCLADGESGQTVTSLFLPLAKAQSIGMPLPAKPPAHFTEQLVDADVPLAIAASVRLDGVLGANCGPVGAHFKPVKGRDYEASVGSDGKRCWVQLAEIVTAGGVVRSERMLSAPALPCPATRR